jgi:hypothetical protein
MTTLSMTASATSHMGSIANDSGRNVTNSSPVNLNPNPVSPGSHGGGDEYSMGARFTTDAGITNGLTITSATYKMTAQATWNAAPDVIAYLVSAHAADNAGALATTNGNLNTTARPRTTAVSGVWTQTSVTVDTQYSIDVTSVVQELINRGGWAAGNSIVIIVDTNSTTTASQWQDYYGTGANVPVLDIVYTAGGGVTGDASYTQASDTVSSSGTVAISGTASYTQASDTVASAGTVAIDGSSAYTQADDTLSAAGSVGSAPITGDVAYTQDNDTVSASGTVDIIGASAVTQADDTTSAAGTVAISGASAYTQADDTTSAAGTVAIAGSAAYTQDGDTVSATGVTLAYVVSGISVGEGYSDITPKQIVRTSGNRAYVAAVNCDSYPGDGTSNKIMMYKAGSTGLATSFSEQDSASRPSGGIAQWGIAIDGSDIIHVIYNTRSTSGGNVTDTRYVTFDTSTDTWGTSVSIDNTVNFSEDSGNQGVESVAIAIDASSYPHVVYLATDGTRRRMKYTNRTSGSWAASTTIDDQSFASNEKIWHPNLAFDVNGRILFTWHIGTFNDTADGRVYIRTRETNGTLNTTVAVSGANTALTSIDNSGSLHVLADNTYELSFINASTTPGNKYIRYFYSVDDGVTWTANHPDGGNQATHNPGVGPNGVGGTRITAHGTPNASNIGENIYYFSGTGGAGTWSTWTLQVTDADAECSINQRWSQYHHNYPGILDFIYWHAAYPNDLFYAGEIVLQGAAAITQAGDTTSAAGTVAIDGSASVTQAGDTLAADGTVGSTPITGDAAYTQDNDTVSAAGTVEVIGAASVTQDSDTASASGTVSIIGTSTYSQADDTLSADGIVGNVPIIGEAAYTQDSDTVASVGTVSIIGTVDVTQEGDSVTADGTVAVSGSASITQAGDTLSATGTSGSLPTIQGTIYIVVSAVKPRVDVSSYIPNITYEKG